MKKIYLIRHAKSSWKEEGISDFKRSLNKRGEADLAHMAKRLKNFHILPDLIVSSPAKRAKTTAKEIANTIGFKKSNIAYQDRLYESSYDTYRYLLDSLDDKLNSIFIVAHNPTITQVGEVLSGAILTNMPTCSIVCIEFDTQSFKDIKNGEGKILFFDYPKKHDIA
ncbi:MAG: histidine phosphatase family protein [Epsilonproteobacteria bacterium]|nr:histidine phosphatase family protein [Campylobacterota bacterium]